MSSLSRRIKVVEAEFLLFVRLEAAIEVTGVGANALMGETAANAKAKMAFIMVSEETPPAWGYGREQGDVLQSIDTTCVVVEARRSMSSCDVIL